MLHEDVVDLWDTFHPSDSDEEVEFAEAGDYSDLETVPLIPTIDLLPDTVDYSARGPGDFVVSGPLGVGKGNGRWFSTAKEAKTWVMQKYGTERVRYPEGEGSEFRWAFLIKAVV